MPVSFEPVVPVARTKNTRYLPRPSSRPDSGWTRNVAVPSGPVVPSGTDATREYGTPRICTLAPRTTKPRVSLIWTLTVNVARVRSSGGANDTFWISSCDGSSTVATSIDLAPPGSVTTPVGPSAILAVGTVVVWPDPLAFEAVTTTRKVEPASVSASV